jgi:hypothetical protein
MLHKPNTLKLKFYWLNVFIKKKNCYKVLVLIFPIPEMLNDTELVIYATTGIWIYLLKNIITKM